MMNLSILWRGPLSSCNYACPYCPFAKRVDTRETLRADRAALERFVAWIGARPEGDRISVFFTPWGEALIRSWYRDAMRDLSRMPHVPCVAIQTNLSCPMEWVEACDPESVGFWCTWHPGQVPMEKFLGRCRTLDEFGMRYSVGVVGMAEHVPAIEALRTRLAPSIYLWVNAYKRMPEYYGESDLARLIAIDPLFELNLRRHASRGRACAAGETVISVNGEGVARRCHFIAEPIGNIYDPEFASMLKPRPCPAESCGCHIGYSHMPDLDVASLFGNGLLPRIPLRQPQRADALARLARFRAQVSSNGE